MFCKECRKNVVSYFYNQIILTDSKDCTAIHALLFICKYIRDTKRHKIVSPILHISFYARSIVM